LSRVAAPLHRAHAHRYAAHFQISSMPAVCRSTCGETRFRNKEGQVFRATAAYLATRYRTESELRAATTALGNKTFEDPCLVPYPRREDSYRRLSQRCASLLPCFYLVADVRTRAKRDVALPKGPRDSGLSHVSVNWVCGRWRFLPARLPLSASSGQGCIASQLRRGFRSFRRDLSRTQLHLRRR
jgi:hypothetical protein